MAKLPMKRVVWRCYQVYCGVNAYITTIALTWGIPDETDLVTIPPLGFGKRVAARLYMHEIGSNFPALRFPRFHADVPAKVLISSSPR